jgi:hypothetical protein
MHSYKSRGQYAGGAVDAGMLPNPHSRLYFSTLGTNVAAHQQSVLCQAAQVPRILQPVDIPRRDVVLRRKARRPESVSYQERSIGASCRLHYRGIERTSFLVEYDGGVLSSV